MKNKSASFFGACAVMILAIVALVMPFASGLVKTESITILGAVTTNTEYIKGFDLIFGSSDSNGNVLITQISGLLIAWLVMAAAGVFATVGVLLTLISSNKINLGRISVGFAGLLALASGILFFFSIPMSGYENSSAGGGTLGGSVTYTLAIGFILAACFGVTAGLIGLFSSSLSKKASN